MGIPFYNPKPAPPNAYKQHVLPYNRADPWSKLTFGWCSAIFKLALSRPLEDGGEYSCLEQSV